MRYADEEHVRRHAPATRTRRLLLPRQLRGYDRAWLRADLLAGITIAALVVPLGLAFAELAGLPAVYGLYSSMLPVLVFAVLASTPQAVMGAEAALAGIVAAAIAPLVARGEDPVQVAGTLAVLAGAICIIGAALRLGRVAQLVSRPVFTGYLSGVAVIVSIGQLPKLLGADPYEHDEFLGQISELGRVLSQVEPATATIGVVTLAALLVGRIVAPGAPVALGAIITGSVITWLLDLQERGVATVGELPRELPRVLHELPPADDLRHLVPAAAVIALIGFIDTTVVTQGFAARRRYRVDSTRDLGAQGVADVVSGIFGGLPLSASTARTAVADSSGAHSQLAAATSAGVILGVLVVAAELMAWVPLASLAGIVIAVMIGVADLATLRRLAATRPWELVVALAAFAGVLMLGVLDGVLVAVAVSLLVFVQRALRPHDAVLGHVDDARGWYAVDERSDARVAPGLLVYRFDAPLFFANADTFRARLLTLLDERPDVRCVIVEGAAITDIDYTASRVLEELAVELRERDVELTFAELATDLIELLRRDGVVTRIGAAAFHRTLSDAEAAWIARGPLTDPPNP